jgi:hypothetical protein
MKVIWILEMFTLVCSPEILELMLVRVWAIYYFLTPSFLSLGSMSPHLKQHDIIILVFEIPPIKMPSPNPCSLPPLESMLVYYIKLQHSQNHSKGKRPLLSLANSSTFKYGMIKEGKYLHSSA